jgi:predicted RNA-binding Zn ribbon-like protein
MKETRDSEIHHLVGGELCLNFANTLYGHASAPIHEYLLDYRDVVLWSRHAGNLTSQEAHRLLQETKRHSKEAQKVFQRAIVLREAIYRIFADLAQARSPKADDLTALQAAWLEALAHSHLHKTSAGFHLDWNDNHSLGRMLWPILDSAVKLLTSEDAQQVKQCNGCDWLFVDRSRNHLRRWCSMDVCGNRAKMRRRYARRKMNPE